MIDNNTKELILRAVKNEHGNACKEYGDTYNSAHEGWAVVKEELDEVIYEIEAAKTEIMLFWDSVRHNSYGVMRDSVKRLSEHATMAMTELAQVATCCMKMEQTIDKLGG